jgi:hypothetical protein
MIIYILSGMTGALARINLSYQNAYVKTINNDERLPIINKINNSLNLGKLDYLKITFFTLLLLLAWHLTIRFRFK